MSSDSNKICSITGKILSSIGSNLELSSTKAILAKMRQSIGREFSQTIGVWENVYSEIPVENLSSNGKPTYVENAIISTLQLYAFHQQGNKKPVCYMYDDFKKNKEDNKKIIYRNMGYSLSELRQIDTTNNSEAIDKRFVTMITSSTFNELIVHLRQLIGIFKSKSESKIDYVRLANDLYWFQNNGQENVKLNWGRSYFGNFKQEEKNEK